MKILQLKDFFLMLSYNSTVEIVCKVNLPKHYENLEKIVMSWPNFLNTLFNSFDLGGLSFSVCWITVGVFREVSTDGWGFLHNDQRVSLGNRQ